MDVMTIVTDRILGDLEKGTIPWKKPWCAVSGAYNRVTGKTYSLLNRILLKHGGEYATYRQWTEAGGSIKKGAESEIITFWKWPVPAVPADDDLSGGEVNESGDDTDGMADYGACKTDCQIYKKGPTLRYYRVFHVSQVDGVAPRQQETTFPSKPIMIAESLFQEYVRRENIRLETELSNDAYYSPSRDLIHIPHINQYPPEKVAGYYATAFHEAVHSTGHVNRLDRDGLKNVAFGSEIYSKEELVAEIGSACILQSLGIRTEDTRDNTSAYIQGWLSVLKRDKRVIPFAAAQADKAVQYILRDVM